MRREEGARVGLASCVLAAVAVLWLVWVTVRAVVVLTASGQPVLLIPVGTFLVALLIPVIVLGHAGWVVRTGPTREAAAAATRGRYVALGLGVFGVVGGLSTASTGGALSGVAAVVGVAMLPLGATLDGAAEALNRSAQRVALPVGRTPSTGPIDPDLAAVSQPYPYPRPLPTAARTAHLDALMDRGFRATAWGLVFMPGMLVACVPLFWGARRRGPSDPSLFLTHPIASAAMLGFGVLLMGIAVPGMARHWRAKTRHKRLLAAYGVNVTDEGEVLPTRPRRW